MVWAAVVIDPQIAASQKAVLRAVFGHAVGWARKACTIMGTSREIPYDFVCGRKRMQVWHLQALIEYAAGRQRTMLRDIELAKARVEREIREERSRQNAGALLARGLLAEIRRRKGIAD